jgi:imidazolonepropionase-like amidohydrolase
MLFITGGKILTMAGPVYENGFVTIENGKIVKLGEQEVSPDCRPPDNQSAIFDATGYTVMPGLIESHCHMGIAEEKKGREGDDCNESVEPITPWLRGIDAINTMDAAFNDAIRAGITGAMIGPGSANIVGGQFAFLKTWGRCIDDLIVLAPAAMKIAFGENPKLNYSNQQKSPATRMAIAGLLREELFKARHYLNRSLKDDDEPDFRYECWRPVFAKEIPLKAHAHRADDIFTAIRIAREFDLDMTIEHCTEGHLIAEELKEAGYPAVVGSDLSSRDKIEMQNLAFKTVGILNRAGIKTAIATDHPVSLIGSLNICAALAVKAGLDYLEALKCITINAAEICRVSHRVGSLRIGKDADVAIFDGDPLQTRTKTMATIIDGKIAYMDKEAEKRYTKI